MPSGHLTFSTPPAFDYFAYSLIPYFLRGRLSILLFYFYLRLLDYFVWLLGCGISRHFPIHKQIQIHGVGYSSLYTCSLLCSHPHHQFKTNFYPSQIWKHATALHLYTHTHTSHPSPSLAHLIPYPSQHLITAEVPPPTLIQVGTF